MERESSRQNVEESKEAASKGPVNATSMREGYRTAAHDIVAGRCCTFDHSSPLLLLDVEFPFITRPTGGQCWLELTCRCRRRAKEDGNGPSMRMVCESVSAYVKVKIGWLTRRPVTNRFPT